MEFSNISAYHGIMKNYQHNVVHST